MLKTIKNIPQRVWKASAYSLAGLKSAYRREESIRLEALAFGLLFIVMLLVPWPFWKKAAMMAVYLLIPMCELFNSALEDICDLVTGEYNEYVKTAKDKGSAAVLIAIAVNLIALCALIAV